MPENTAANLLLSLQRTCGLQCLVALWSLGPLPVTTRAVVEFIGESDESAKRGLRRLRTCGLAICDEIGGRETNWRLAPAAIQLPLPIDLLGLSEPAYPALTHPAIAPAQLQVGQPGDAVAQAQAQLQAEDPASDTTPQKPESATPGNAESARAGIIIISKDSLKDNSLINNKNPRQNATPQKPESPDSERERPRPPRHIADILRALKSKGQPALADDPFPSDLRTCVERLQAIGCSRKRAERAVAHSPWDAPTLLAEIARWKARLKSPEGQTITRSGFPWLVAARLESGEKCPPGEYELEPEPETESASEPEMSADVPSEPPPFIALPPPPTCSQPIEERWLKVWSAALDQLRREMPPSTFDFWFQQSELVAVEQGDGPLEFVIQAESKYHADWLTNRLSGAVTRALTHLADQPITPRFKCRAGS